MAEKTGMSSRGHSRVIWFKKTIDMTWENAYYMYLRFVGFSGHLFTGIFFTMYVSNECDICHSGLLHCIEQGV